MYNVAITGQIGSGKTTVSSIFAKLFNITVLNADEYNKNIINKSNIIKKIHKKFGDDILLKNNKINTYKLKKK